MTEAEWNQLRHNYFLLVRAVPIEGDCKAVYEKDLADIRKMIESTEVA